MKRRITALSCSATRIVGKSAFLVALSVFFSVAAFSQTATSPANEIGDLSGILWKSVPAMEETFVSEKARMDVALTQTDLSLSDRALYLSYQRLLDYVRTGVQGGAPVNEVIVQEYEKVLEEAPKDVVLKHLPDGVLITYIPGLVEALAETPTPAAGQ